MISQLELMVYFVIQGDIYLKMVLTRTNAAAVIIAGMNVATWLVLNFLDDLGST